VVTGRDLPWILYNKIIERVFACLQIKTHPGTILSVVIVGTCVNIVIGPEYVMYRGLRWGEVKERDHLENVEIDRSSILTF